MQNFRNLEIWELGHRITLRVYEITKSFPTEERYGVVGQMRRASASIPTNIAEGCMRQSDPEFRRFLHIALGSVSELDYLVILSSDLGYIVPSVSESIVQEITQLRRMIITLIQKLESSDRILSPEHTALSQP